MEYLKLLEGFYHAGHYLIVSKSVTISLIYPTLSKLVQKLEEGEWLIFKQ